MQECGLTAELTRSKTTVPGKRVLTLPIVVSNDAWFSCKSWLGEGLKIWKSIGHSRDYLLPCATGDLCGARECIATYHHATIYSQALLCAIGTPHLKCPAEPDNVAGCIWTSGEERLLIPGSGRYWPEHSERNGLTSLAAVL